MKKIREFIASNLRQLVEIFILILVAIFPFCVNIQGHFKQYLENNIMSPDNYIWYKAISIGNYGVSVLLVILCISRIRKFNQDFLMNQMRVYHDYCYVWYWFCAKILGITKCNLILVPIFMQFKLAIRATFADYPLNENEFPSMENEADCKVELTNLSARKSEINFILEDTYPVDYKQIPYSKKDLLTIKISRNDGNSKGRHFSQKFIETITNELHKMNTISKVNVFATTNPMNTLHIAKRVFALGERGNIKHLYVFQQNNCRIRRFEDKAHRIY